MTVLEMLHAIEGQKVVYNIHYCRAGVGFMFYSGPEAHPPDWRNHLTVETYHPTFESAVEAEFARLEVGAG